ncbi:MAG: alkaline phosphatase family protein [Pseudomonadales bacterium]
MRFLIVMLLALIPTLPAWGAARLVLVTVDGVRWQEVYRGIDPALATDERFSQSGKRLLEDYGDDDPIVRRQRLMPFFWGTVDARGAHLGNRDQGSQMAVSNGYYFSYPGYNEILTGAADPTIDSNDKRWNANVTLLEWLDGQPAFAGRVAAFGSWDVFPYILNTPRSRLPVNAGFEPLTSVRNARVTLLNRLQTQIPSPWESVRLDAFTHHFALEYLQRHRPRVLYVAYGEPDDFAHDGRYDHYVDAIHRFDAFLADLWSALGRTRGYADNTQLLITTDHGRGDQPTGAWQYHASRAAMAGNADALNAFPDGVIGSNHVWLAALGPAVRARHLQRSAREWSQNQVAATALRLLGQDPAGYRHAVGHDIGAPIDALWQEPAP